MYCSHFQVILCYVQQCVNIPYYNQQDATFLNFLILNFRRVLIVVSFLLGKSPASLYYCMPTFRNSLSVLSSKAMVEHTT